MNRKDIDKAIFDARLKGDRIRFQLAFTRRARTKQIIKLLDAGTISWSARSEGLGQGIFFQIEENMVIQLHPRLRNILERQSVIRADKGHEIVIYRLDLSMLLDYYNARRAEVKV